MLLLEILILLYTKNWFILIQIDDKINSINNTFLYKPQKNKNYKMSFLLFNYFFILYIEVILQSYNFAYKI